MPQRENIEKLVREYHRRLQKLKEQEARYGYSVEPSILLEIEGIEEKIQELQAELNRLKTPANLPKTADQPSPKFRLDTDNISDLNERVYFSCFISYSSKDETFAQQLHADLQRHGVRCWYAPHDMKIGAKIRSTIDRSIQAHDKLLLILSKRSIDSDWVEKEVETAFEKESKYDQWVLFPIRLDNAVMDTNQAWAADIRRTRHIGDFSRWKDHDAYQAAFERLLRDLKAEE